MSGPAERTRRLFFAFWPDEATREAMHHSARKAVRGSGGRPVPASNLHVTVAFLGSVAESLRPEVERIGAEVAAEGFGAGGASAQASGAGGDLFGPAGCCRGRCGPFVAGPQPAAHPARRQAVQAPRDARPKGAAPGPGAGPEARLVARKRPDASRIRHRPRWGPLRAARLLASLTVPGRGFRGYCGRRFGAGREIQVNLGPASRIPGVPTRQRAQ